MTKPKDTKTSTRSISGGYILLSRKLLESDLMHKPALHFKLWVWMLERANWKDRGKLKRGQLIASLSDLQNAMAHYSGWRRNVPTRGEIRSAYEFFAKSGMISHTKSTRGMIITILNFDLYQDPQSYGPPGGNIMEDTAPTYDTEEGEKGRKEGQKADKRLSDPTPFQQFWAAYPNKKAKVMAEKAWRKIDPDEALFRRILAALEQQKTSESWQQDGGRFIPHPATWLNGRRWEDVVETGLESQEDELAELRDKGVIE